jgi:cell division protein FtsB
MNEAASVLLGFMAGSMGAGAILTVFLVARFVKQAKTPRNSLEKENDQLMKENAMLWRTVFQLRSDLGGLKEKGKSNE